MCEAGIHPENSPIDRHTKSITNIGFIIATVINPLILIGIFLTFGYPGPVLITITLLVEVLYFLVFVLTTNDKAYSGRVIFSITILASVFSYSYFSGVGAGAEFYFFPIGVGSYLVWPEHRKNQLALTLAAFSLFFFFITLNNGSLFTATNLSLLFKFNVALAFITCTIALNGYAHDSQKTLITLDKQQIQARLKAKQREEQMMSFLYLLSEVRDTETGNHILRTQHYIKALAYRLSAKGLYRSELSDEKIEMLFKVSPLHDLGKMGIPDKILQKPDKLTESEWETMKTHAIIGESILKSVESKYRHLDANTDELLTLAIQIAGNHHEKWDGSGYPRKLSGQDIPLSARLMSLADVYDALVCKRVYKNGWTHEEAIREITDKAGSHFDPQIVEAFLEEADNFKKIALKYQD